MFERTDFCPYTDICESFQIIGRAQSWIERELARMRRVSAQGLPSGGGGYSIHILQGRLEHMRRVKERCYSYNGRCLRYWQFKARDEEMPKPRRGELAWPPQIIDEKAVIGPTFKGPDDKIEG